MAGPLSKSLIASLQHPGAWPLVPSIYHLPKLALSAFLAHYHAAPGSNPPQPETPAETSQFNGQATAGAPCAATHGVGSCSAWYGKPAFLGQGMKPVVGQLAPSAAAQALGFSSSRPHGFHTSSAALLPQIGGYMRTGGSAADPDGHAHVPRFLVTGACGQVGQEFVPFLRNCVGNENVVASDVRTSRKMLESGPFHYCDVQDKDNMARLMLENGITHVVHLATLLSAVGERNPALALKVNTIGIQNVLDLAAQHGLGVYAPSTIAVFGAHTPRHNTPDHTIMRPTTMYGITKVHQELLGQYYADRYGVDYRSLRYPGIISANSPPGGGTTDYAVEIFHAALSKGHYNCFLSAETALPMMYMPDCLAATWRLMQVHKEVLSQTTYNVTALSFTPAELGEAIRHYLPNFTISYTPDFREEIAQTWPVSIDDSAARKEWSWEPEYDLQALARDMLVRLAPRYGKEAEVQQRVQQEQLM